MGRGASIVTIKSMTRRDKSRLLPSRSLVWTLDLVRPHGRNPLHELKFSAQHAHMGFRTSFISRSSWIDHPSPTPPLSLHALFHLLHFQILHSGYFSWKLSRSMTAPQTPPPLTSLDTSQHCTFSWISALHQPPVTGDAIQDAKNTSCHLDLL